MIFLFPLISISIQSMWRGNGNRFSTLAWRIPWTEEPGRLQSMGSQRVRHNWSDWAHIHCCCQVTSVVSNSVRPRRWQPTRLPHPWDSPGKSTGVGCHFLLQCMKVKSESEVAQSCLTLSDPMDCSPPGSSIQEIFQTRVLEWGAIAFSAHALAVYKWSEDLIFWLSFV